MIYVAGFVLIAVLSIMVLSVTSQAWRPVLTALLLSYSFLVSLRFFIYTFGSVVFAVNRMNERRKPVPDSFSPKVSVILPAFNEEKVIGEVLRGFQKVRYSEMEVLVVDDGSSDNTFETARAVGDSLNLDIRVFTKPNGGKAGALNFGISKSRGEFVLCMDADSLLEPDSITRGIRHFYDNDNLAAVAGVVRAENGDQNLLARFQQLDYYIGHFQRKFLSVLGMVSIVPGPIGLFRKSAIAAVGGYESENATFAEDTELTFRLIASGWQVICEDNMVAWTEVPVEYNNLVRQRYRWSRGVYQALVKNLDTFNNSGKSNNLAFLIFLIWEQILIPILDFAFLFSFVSVFLVGESLSYYTPMLAWVLIADISIAVLASLRDRSIFYWLPVAVASRLTYVNVLLVWKMLAFYDEWKSVGMSWDKLSRNGFVNTGKDEGWAS